MCGLLGHSFSAQFAQSLSPEQRLVMNVALATNMDKRGGDSWGLADVYNPREWRPHIEKGLNNLTPHVLGPMAKPAVARIGHTRKRTTGAITERNAHPFDIEGVIVGAHNGIVYNHSEVAKTLGVSVEVDSEVIFHAICRGVDLSEVKAYGAITYCDLRNPGHIYMGRFNGGQLAVYGVGDDPDKTQGLVWASTSDAVEAALEAAGLDGFSFKIEEDKLYFAVGGRLFVSGDKLNFGRGYTSYTTRYGGGYKGRQEMLSLGDDDTCSVDDHRWANYWESRNSGGADGKKKEGEVGGVDTEVETEEPRLLTDGERTLAQLWKEIDGWSETDLSMFFMRVADKQCYCCQQDWTIYSISWDLQLCDECAAETADVTPEDIFTYDEVKRLAWSWQMQQRSAALTGGWSVH